MAAHQKLVIGSVILVFNLKMRTFRTSDVKLVYLGADLSVSRCKKHLEGAFAPNPGRSEGVPVIDRPDFIV
jgi:hypothetical protein